MNLRFKYRERYAIGLTLYHPEVFILKRIDLILQQGFRLFIFDNSPGDDKYVDAIKNKADIFYLTAGKNIGLGYSLSILCATAYAQGYPRLLFLDQDTRINCETLEFIESFVQTQPTEVKEEYSALVFSGDPGCDQSVQEVRLAISSGSLFNLPVLGKIGWHNEKFFVDCVDYEFCMRSRRCGFKIGLVKNTPGFDHVSEQPDRSIRILSKQVLVRRYATSRFLDAIRAYTRLIVSGILQNNLRDTAAIAKSASIYIVGQIFAHTLGDHP